MIAYALSITKFYIIVLLLDFVYPAVLSRYKLPSKYWFMYMHMSMQLHVKEPSHPPNKVWMLTFVARMP